jgi:hypothetical protein
VLKPAYVEGSTALMILAFAALATAVGSLLDQTLSGRVTVDADDSARFKHYLHSDLFFVFLVNFGSTVTYIVSVFLIVLAGKGQGTNFAPTLDLWAVAQVVVYAAFMVIRIPRVRRGGKLSLRPSFPKYVVGSIIMGAFLVVAGGFLSYTARSFEFGAEVAAIGLVGAAIYFGFVFATDGAFRRLTRRLLKPIMKSGEP